MKRNFRKSIVILFSVMFSHGGMGGLSVQGQETNSFKNLITKKFDTNLDGSLDKQEGAKATAFLQNLDKNGDGGISADEQAVAVANLKKMPDPVAAPPPMPPKTTQPPRRVGGKKSQPTKTEIISIQELEARIAKANKAQEKAAKGRDQTPNPGSLPENRGKKSYYSGTTILLVGSAGIHTVVPEGAVLSAPPEAVIKVVKKPVGLLLIWPRFLAKYSKLITAKEVSWNTAKGLDPIKEGEKKAFAQGGKVVVAVFHKHPVSVLEPPKEEEGEDTTVEGSVKSDKKKKRK